MACGTTYNCSSGGSCSEGVCVCPVEFTGENCSDTNKGFTAAFSSLYGMLFIVSFVQLVLCVNAEYRKLKCASFWSACRLTTQKLLHLLILMAALTRILYFALMGLIPSIWLKTMELVYDPLLITGMSLVVCYWSEAFFLEDVSTYASRGGCFLSKSWLAFTLFNLFLYLCVVVQFIVVYSGAIGTNQNGHWLGGAFQSFFALVLFILYVIFMTIGVEMYFKVRGAFNLKVESIPTSREAACEIMNAREVLKSRLAIVVQALFLLMMVLCAVSEAVATLWKDKVDVHTRSLHTVMHRMAEVGVVLWFPCVLWNSAYPEQLWFLNPRKLLRLKDNNDARDKFDAPVIFLLYTDVASLCAIGMCGVEVEACIPVLQSLISRRYSGYNTFSRPGECSSSVIQEQTECWICFDDTSLDDFIAPCLCKGGMSKVHHNCLKRWLLENNHNNGKPSCGVCKHEYHMQKEYPGAVPCQPCAKWTSTLISALVVCAVAPCVLIYLFKTQNEIQTPIKVTIVGFCILLVCICLKIFDISLSSLLRLTRESSMRIFDYESPMTSSDNDVSVSQENDQSRPDIICVTHPGPSEILSS